MSLRRRTLLALIAAAAALGTRTAPARPASSAHRIGVLMVADREEVMANVKERDWELLVPLANLGYVHERNLTFEWRFISRDFSDAARMGVELARLGMDLLLTQETTPTRALQDATRTIPIVTAVDDPVASGFARSLGRPGGNITGLCLRHPDTPAKHVELLRIAVPGLKRLVIIGSARNSGAKQLLQTYEVAASAAGLAAEVRLIEEGGIERVFMEMKGSRVRAAFIEFAGQPLAEVARLAIRYSVATMLYDMQRGNPRAHGYIEFGGLMSFTMYFEKPYLRLASIIDKILRGVKPADIPWELPDRSHFAINLATARLLGLKVPTELLLRADQVIE